MLVCQFLSATLDCFLEKHTNTTHIIFPERNKTTGGIFSIAYFLLTFLQNRKIGVVTHRLKNKVFLSLDVYVLFQV